MRCPSCFDEKRQALTCPFCGFEEQPDRHQRFLPYRHMLNNGRYVVGQVLGKAGGFGVAYKTLDTRQRAVVVVKECLLTESGQVHRNAGEARVVVNPGFEDEYRRWLKRFHDEAALISRFNNPYIVRVTEVFEENNTSYYVMPFVEGTDLRHHCAERGGKLPQDEVAQIAQKLLSALSEVHATGFLHRDIKPSNILITKNKRKPVLIDFGAARNNFEAERSGSHMAMFTTQYAPYEQVKVLADQGPWTDIYSLSATLYQCLTGEPPPKVENRFNLQGGKTDPLVPIHQRLADIRPGLATVINNGLAVLPSQRLRDAATALQWLDDSTVPSGQAESPPNAPANTPPNTASQHATPWPTVEWVGLLPAVAVLGASLVLPQGFERILAGWPGLLALLNSVVWLLWFIQRRALAREGRSGTTTTGLGSTDLQPGPDQVVAVEMRLVSPDIEPIVRLIRPSQTVSVGRNQQSDVAIPNPLMSSRHVSIKVLPSGEFELQDLGSTNHTFAHERGNKNTPDTWKQIDRASGRKGRFMLGPADGGGVLLELRQTTTAP